MNKIIQNYTMFNSSFFSCDHEVDFNSRDKAAKFCHARNS